MPKYRKAALVVHSLPPGDQKWLLDRLPVQNQEKLSSLLDELKSLGIPKQGLADSLLVSPEKNTPKELPPVELELVINAHDEEISSILIGEPVSVLAAILSVHRWPWHHAVVCNYSDEQQKEISSLVELIRRKGLPPVTCQIVVLSIANLLSEFRNRIEEEGSRSALTSSRRKSSLITGFMRWLWPV